MAGRGKFPVGLEKRQLVSEPTTTQQDLSDPKHTIFLLSARWKRKEHVGKGTTHAHKSNFRTLNFEPLGTTMEEGGDRTSDVEASKYVNRKYERVPGLDEIDQTDYVALAKARDQWVRDR